MVKETFRRGRSTPRRARGSYASRRRRQRLGTILPGASLRASSPHFMRRVRNRPALRHRGWLHAMIRPIVVVGALAALGFGGHHAYQRALTSPALSIQSVRLHQVPNMLIEPVRARLRPAYGQNLLAIDLAALRRSIEELPAVRTAGVRRVLPDGLVVSVAARRPSARVVGEHRVWVIDAEGVVLDTYDPQRRLAEIRVLDAGALHADPGGRITADPHRGAALAAALGVVAWLEDAGGGTPQPINHIRVEELGVVLVAAPARLEIILGDDLDLDAKMGAVRSLLTANPPLQPTVIDARYADMLVVRALETNTE